MKAKLILSVVFLSTFFGNAFCQDYHPLLNNSSWILKKQGNWTPHFGLLQEGTPVVIGDYTYLQYNNPFPEYENSVPYYIFYAREDVATRRVYRLVNGVEIMIYDYNLEVGDTVAQYGYTFTVTTVDTLDVNGNLRKRITLHSNELYQDHYVLKQVWIEGIGSEDHPFYPDCNMRNVASVSGGVKVKTYCSFQNGVHIYGGDNCPDMLLATSDETYEGQKITLSPNPFTTEFTIESVSALQNATFKLYNVQGQLIREINNLNGRQTTISRDKLNSGLYLAQLFEDGKLVKTTKLMVN